MRQIASDMITSRGLKTGNSFPQGNPANETKGAKRTLCSEYSISAYSSRLGWKSHHRVCRGFYPHLPYISQTTITTQGKKSQTSVFLPSTNRNQTVKLELQGDLTVARKHPEKTMTRIKSKSVLRIEFLDSTDEQKVLADYLRGKDAKGQILAATTAQLYPFALAEQDGVDPLDVAFAFARSIADLEMQIKVMRQYQQIKLGQNRADNLHSDPPLVQKIRSKKSVAIDEEDDERISDSEGSNFSVFKFNN
jgi:hypothetical protein